MASTRVRCRSSWESGTSRSGDGVSSMATPLLPALEGASGYSSKPCAPGGL